MRQRTVLVAVAFVVVAIAVVGAGLVAASGSAQENNSTENASAGASISSFMQASAAQTEGDVERGMWQAAFEHANESERARMVHERTEELDRRADRLEAQRGELPDNASNVSAVARMAAFNARTDSLTVAVNVTSEAAERANVSPPGLEKVKERAKGLEKSKPDVPGDVDDPDGERPGVGTPGKPDDPGKAPDGPPGQNKTTTDAPETTDVPDGPGSPDDPGNGSGGPPTDKPGTGNDGGSGGPPTDEAIADVA